MVGYIAVCRAVGSDVERAVIDDVVKPYAIQECVVADIRHGTSELDGVHIAALAERGRADIRHGIGNANRSELAIMESIVCDLLRRGAYRILLSRLVDCADKNDIRVFGVSEVVAAVFFVVAVERRPESQIAYIRDNTVYRDGFERSG